jgi:hypothetical protein
MTTNPLNFIYLLDRVKSPITMLDVLMNKVSLSKALQTVSILWRINCPVLIILLFKLKKNSFLLLLLLLHTKNNILYRRK